MNQKQNITQLILNSQYVKDLSFENTGAPVNIVNPHSDAEIKVSINVNTQYLQENIYEVTLHITITSDVKNSNLFLVDMQYAGLFTLQNFPEEDIQEILLVECPKIIFPFARRVIADITRDGAIQPLMLEPLNFAELFREHRETQLEQHN